jgi:prepilin-type processing-associated H-X9-DG protein/prepilin-type N-terminal cleavage/methylation domain-containing protein
VAAFSKDICTMKTRTTSDRRLRAFSLTEMMVVIAIVSMLGSMAVPKLLSTRDRAKAVACASNLREIGMAVSLYAMDHAGQLPEAWNEPTKTPYTTLLEPYVSQVEESVKHDKKNVFVCPGNKLPPQIVDSTVGIYTYSMNIILGNGTVRLPQIKSPSTTFVFTDGTQVTSNGNLASGSIYQPWQLFWVTDPNVSVPPDNDSDSSASGGSVRYRHAGAANFLMADGHVEAIKAGTLLSRTGGMMWEPPTP